MLRAGGEPALIVTAAPAGSSILELGAGVGRVTHPLVSLGYEVTAVDNSAEMLAEIRGASTVLCDIEELALKKSFDAVVLGSFLIHTPAPGARAALLQTCRRHVSTSGVVLVQYHSGGWPGNAAPGFLGERDGVKIFVDEVRHEGRLVHTTLRYVAASGTWTHSFATELLSLAQIQAALANADLTFERHLDPELQWLLARPRV